MAITAQKFLPQGKRGGNLAVTPKTSLIKSPKESGNIVFTIQKKIILVDDLLKGTLAEKEKRQKDEIKQKEDESISPNCILFKSLGYINLSPLKYFHTQIEFF